MHKSIPFRLRNIGASAALIVLTAGFASAMQEDEHGHEGGHEEEGHHEEASKHDFEWSGVYLLQEGLSELVIQPGPDLSLDVVLMPVADASAEAFDAAVAAADQIFASTPQPMHPGEELEPSGRLFRLQVSLGSEMRFAIRAAAAGHYVLFTQHFADEFQTTIVRAGEPQFPVSARDLGERSGQVVVLPAAQEALGVVLAPVGHHVLIPTFSAPARVSYNSERMAHVGTAVFGRVVDLAVRLGDTMSAGDVMAIVESPEFGAAQSEYLLRRALSESAAPVVEVARSSYERARKLHDENQGISLTEVQRRQAELLAAEAALLNARAALLDAANRLQLLGMKEAEIQALAASGAISARHPIVAPIDGRVIRRDVTLGELVRPDQPALFVLADTSQLWVLVDVPETRLKDVMIGATARIVLAAFPDSRLDGVVSFVNPELDSSTRTAQIRLDALNPHGQFLPGMFAVVELEAGGGAANDPAQRGVLAVPESAIQTIEGRPVVFVPLADRPNTFLKRPVTIGESVGGMVPVSFGLRPGETIVTAGSFIFKAELGKSSAKHEH